MAYFFSFIFMLCFSIEIAAQTPPNPIQEIPALSRQTPKSRYYTMDRLQKITYEGIIMTKMRISYSASNLANVMTVYDEQTQDVYKGQTPAFTRTGNGKFQMLVAKDPEVDPYVDSSPWPESVGGADQDLDYLPSVHLVPSYTQMKLDKHHYDGAVGVLRMTEKAYSLSTSILQN